MPELSTSALYTALAFHRAWTSHDLDQAMAYVVPDIICHTPMGPMNGAAELRAFIGSLSMLVARYELVAAFGDTRAAVLIHHVDTVAGRAVPVAEYLVIDNDIITGMTIVVDRASFDAFGQSADPRNPVEDCSLPAGWPGSGGNVG